VKNSRIANTSDGSSSTIRIEIEGSRIMKLEVEFGGGDTPTDESAAA